MATQLTADHAKQSLIAHVEAKGAEIHAKYGPQLGWDQLKALLDDRSCVRYPCTIEFDSSRLQPGEFAYPEANGELPESGFTIRVHPRYMNRLDQVPFLVLYQLVIVNYGEFASPDDAEVFAATSLGLDREVYYTALCALADELDESPAGAVHDGPPSGCSCGAHG